MDLKEILDALIELIRTEVSDFSSIASEQAVDQVREYKGEYAPNGEWTPSFPTCFIDTVLITPVTFANDGSVLKSSITFDLYIGNRFNQTDHILNTISRIFEVLNTKLIETGGNQYIFQCGPIQFLGNAVDVKVYKMKVTSL